MASVHCRLPSPNTQHVLGGRDEGLGQVVLCLCVLPDSEEGNEELLSVIIVKLP